MILIFNDNQTLFSGVSWRIGSGMLPANLAWRRILCPAAAGAGLSLAAWTTQKSVAIRCVGVVYGWFIHGEQCEHIINIWLNSYSILRKWQETLELS